MKNLTFPMLLCVSCVFSISAQDRASMSPPVIKNTMEEMVLAARFEDLAPGAQYRLGVGTDSGKINAKIELLKGNTLLQKNVVNFEQGYTSSWWNVERVFTQGFVLSQEDLPRENEQLTLRISIPRQELNKLKKLYILVARNYGETRWYVEDGIELDDTYW